VGADGTTFYRKYPDGTTVGFRSDGLETFSKDRFGNATSYSYDGTNRLWTISDPIGKVTTFSYKVGCSGNWTISDPMSRVTSARFDGQCNVYSIEDPAGGYPIQSASYDSQHQLQSWVDRRGGAWNISYDCWHRPSVKTMPAVTVQVGDTGQANTRPVIRMVSSADHVALCPSSTQGTSSTPVAAALTANVRDSVFNARGYATAYQVDPFGAPLRIEEPLGRVTVFTRDSASRLRSETSVAFDRMGTIFDGGRIGAGLATELDWIEAFGYVRMGAWFVRP
jgi:YD repeat-containing protein